MAQVLNHALRNAPKDKPHPPWLQQLRIQWQAAMHALGSTHGSEPGLVAIDGSSLSHDRRLRRKSSLQKLKEALHQTKDALLAAIGMLPPSHSASVEDSWLSDYLRRFHVFSLTFC